MSLTNNQITAQNFKDFLTAILPYLGGGSGGGHKIEDNEETELTQRNVLQFAGDLEASDDDTNEKTVVTPHELTSAEMAEIMSTLPGTPTDLPVLFDERGTEYVVGYYVDSNGLKKPVYEKTISVPLTAGSLDYAHNIANIDNIIHSKAMWKQSNGLIFMPLTYSNGINTNYVAGYSTSKTTFEIRLSSGFTAAGTVYITLQYTKTTDTPS